MGPTVLGSVIATFGRQMVVRTVSGAKLRARPFGRARAVVCGDEVRCRVDAHHEELHVIEVLARVRASHVIVADAQQRTLEFLMPLVTAGSSPMCGSSICQDRRFLARYMPELERFFHYRNLDVSTLKELARRWAPPVAESFVKQGTHLALADIHESIRELRHYRARLLAPAFSGS